MKTLDQWFEEYGVSHKNPTNKNIHRVCVPLIMLSLLGLMAEIPTPDFMSGVYLNFAHLFVLGSLVFYLLLSLSFSVLMVGLVSVMFFLIGYAQKNLHQNEVLILWVSVFVLSWIGQFVGHKIEGKKPSFLQDLAFLLIGPLWIVAPLFPRYRRPKNTK